MGTNLEAGHLDGFCAGEPWNSMAVDSRAGWCVSVSAELEPGHPEKVLMVREEFAEKRSDEHLALVAALLEACEFCAAPRNAREIAATLARPEYVNVAEHILLRGLDGNFDFGNSRVRSVAEFNIFHGDNANEPGADKAAWVLRHLRSRNLGRPLAQPNAALSRSVFRADIFEQAVRLRGSSHGNSEFPTQSRPLLTPA
jgi:ABC-type nitrate/sulfonate/bicarbonate transport system substrate-binding protein